MLGTYIIQGITLGLSAAITPGPFQAYLLAQTMKNGWQRTLPATLTPFVTDGPIIILVLFILTKTPDWFLDMLQVVGGVFVLYLAYGAFRTFQNASDHQLVSTESASQSFIKAVGINFLNPAPYIFWSVISGPILLEGWRQMPLLGIGFLASFYGGFVVFLVVLVLFFALARTSGPLVVRGLLGLSAIALCVFGIYQLWTGLR